MPVFNYSIPITVNVALEAENQDAVEETLKQVLKSPWVEIYTDADENYCIGGYGQKIEMPILEYEGDEMP